MAIQLKVELLSSQVQKGAVKIKHALRDMSTDVGNELLKANAKLKTLEQGFVAVQKKIADGTATRQHIAELKAMRESYEKLDAVRKRINTQDFNTLDANEVKQFNKELDNQISRTQVLAREHLTLGQRLGNLRDRVDGVRKGFVKWRMALAGTVAAVAATFAMIKAVFSWVVKPVAELNYELARLQAISRATKAEVTELGAQARVMATETLYSAKQTANAMQFLALAGFDVVQTMQSVEHVLNLAAVEQIETSKATRILTGVLRAYNFEADQSKRVSDVLVATSTRTNTTVEELGIAFSYVATIAKQAGIEFEELAATLGLLANANIRGSVAGTALRRVLSSLISVNSRQSKMFREASIAADGFSTSVDFATGELTSLADMISEFSNMQAIDIADIVQVRAYPAIAYLRSLGADEIRRLTEELNNAQNAAKNASDIVEGSLVGSWTQFKNTISAVISQAQFFDLVLTKIINKMTDISANFVDQPKSVAEALTEFAPASQLNIERIDVLTAQLGNKSTRISAMQELKGIQNQFQQFWNAINELHPDAANASADILTRKRGPGIEGIINDMMSVVSSGLGRNLAAGATEDIFAGYMNALTRSDDDKLAIMAVVLKSKIAEINSVLEQHTEDITTSLNDTAQRTRDAFDRMMQDTTSGALADNIIDMVKEAFGIFQVREELSPRYWYDLLKDMDDVNVQANILAKHMGKTAEELNLSLAKFDFEGYAEADTLEEGVSFMENLLKQMQVVKTAIVHIQTDTMTEEQMQALGSMKNAYTELSDKLEEYALMLGQAYLAQNRLSGSTGEASQNIYALINRLETQIRQIRTMDERLEAPTGTIEQLEATFRDATAAANDHASDLGAVLERYRRVHEQGRVTQETIEKMRIEINGLEQATRKYISAADIANQKLKAGNRILAERARLLRRAKEDPYVSPFPELESKRNQATLPVIGDESYAKVDKLYAAEQALLKTERELADIRRQMTETEEVDKIALLIAQYTTVNDKLQTQRMIVEGLTGDLRTLFSILQARSLQETTFGNINEKIEPLDKEIQRLKDRRAELTSRELSTDQLIENAPAIAQNAELLKAAEDSRAEHMAKARADFDKNSQLIYQGFVGLTEVSNAFFQNMIAGSGSMSERFKAALEGMKNSALNTLAKIASEAAVTAAVMAFLPGAQGSIVLDALGIGKIGKAIGGIFGFSSGGLITGQSDVKGYSGGGLVTGNGSPFRGYASGGSIIPRGDTTLIGAKTGEFVINERTVKRVGINALSNLNSGGSTSTIAANTPAGSNMSMSININAGGLDDATAERLFTASRRVVRRHLEPIIAEIMNGN